MRISAPRAGEVVAVESSAESGGRLVGSWSRGAAGIDCWEDAMVGYQCWVDVV